MFHILFVAVIITDVEVQHMKMILEWIYNGQIDVPSTEMNGLFRVAKKLKINGLSMQLSNDAFVDLDNDTREDDLQSENITTSFQRANEQQNNPNQRKSPEQPNQSSHASIGANPPKRARLNRSNHIRVEQNSMYLNDNQFRIRKLPLDMIFQSLI